jgi:hypothetical protein
MLKLQRSRRAVIAVQMVALWILGSLLLPAMYVAILLMMFESDFTGGEVVAWEVTFLVACYAYVLLVIMATRAVSRFGANWYGRAGWA